MLPIPIHLNFISQLEDAGLCSWSQSMHVSALSVDRHNMSSDKRFDGLFYGDNLE